MNVDNKLIAEFLGYETYEMNGVLNVEYSENNIRTIQDTHYHIDWNWLMQVVEKIESLKPFQLMDRNWIGFDVKIYKTFNTQTHYCTIKYLKEQGDMTISNGFSKQSKIDAVYNACVEFIKWYNEQPK
jgi:hypothetical protein